MLYYSARSRFSPRRLQFSPLAKACRGRPSWRRGKGGEDDRKHRERVTYHRTDSGYFTDGLQVRDESAYHSDPTGAVRARPVWHQLRSSFVSLSPSLLSLRRLFLREFQRTVARDYRLVHRQLLLPTMLQSCSRMARVRPLSFIPFVPSILCVTSSHRQTPVSNMRGRPSSIRHKELCRTGHGGRRERPLPYDVLSQRLSRCRAVAQVPQVSQVQRWPLAAGLAVSAHEHKLFICLLTACIR